MVPCLLALGLSPALAAGVPEPELVAAFLAHDAATQRVDLLAARRDAAGLARISAPAFNLSAAREESSGSATAFTTDILSFGVEFELSRANATEQRRADVELTSQEFAMRAGLVEAVTEFRSWVLAAWASQREAALLASQHERTEALLSELELLVAAGEHSRFDLERLRAVDTTHESKTRVAAAAAQADGRRLSLLTGVEIAVPELVVSDELPPGEDLLELVLASHPLLEGLRRHVDSGRLEVELAGLAHPGRLGLRAGYRRDGGPGLDDGDGYELEAAYTLPGRSLRRRDEALAAGEQGARALALARAERRIAADFGSAYARLEALALVHHPVAVDLEAIRRGSLRRYRSGEAELSELIEVLEDLEEREALLLQSEVALLQARLDLDRASGLVTAPELAELVEGLFR
jgi:outer membrane protein TolC